MSKELMIQTSMVPSRVPVILQAFVDQADITDQSKISYRSWLSAFNDYLVKKGMQERIFNLARADILSYKRSMSARRLSRNTISCYLAAVREFYAWVEDETEGDFRTPYRKIKTPPPIINARDALTVEQTRTLLTYCDDECSPRSRAMMHLLCRTGLRTCEIRRAVIGDLAMQQGQEVLHVRGKGGKNDIVILTYKTLKPIEAYLATRSDADDMAAPLFAVDAYNRSADGHLTERSIRRHVRTILDTALADEFASGELDATRISAHSLRNTCITNAILNGASVAQVQSMARHSDVKTTMLYFSNLERISDAAENYIPY